MSTQFDDDLSCSTAATPTCSSCCCCCCCLATVVTAPVVNAMAAGQVARNRGISGAGATTLAFFAPLLGIITGVILGILSMSVGALAVGGLVAIVVMTIVVVGCTMGVTRMLGVPHRTASWSILLIALSTAAFLGEFIAGMLLVLNELGLLYLALVAVAIPAAIALAGTVVRRSTTGASTQIDAPPMPPWIRSQEDWSARDDLQAPDDRNHHP